jgi:hypothetical protein
VLLLVVAGATRSRSNPVAETGGNSMRVVETDNFGGDYPDEKFLNIPNLPEESCAAIAKAINDAVGDNCRRYWKVVANDYKLQPGFEP